MKVVLSEHNLETKEGFEQVYNVSKIYVHNFNYKTFDNDIMLIQVGKNRWYLGLLIIPHVCAAACSYIEEKMLVCVCVCSS